MNVKILQNELKKKKVDLVLIYNVSINKKDPNFFYFTGLDLEFAFLAITEKKKVLFVPQLEYERAKKYSYIKDVRKIKKKNFLKKIKGLKKKVKVIGINKDIVSLNEYKKLRKQLKTKFIDISKILLQLRQIKNKKEIMYLKKSCNIADKILQKTIANFKNFKTEIEVYQYLEKETRKNGCEFAFKPIVASGKNAVMPHYDASEKLKKGFCVIDFGVKYRGYCSDITRTIYLGNPSKKEIEIYNLVLKTQKEVIKQIKVGMKCRKLFDYTVKKLGKYGKYFTHGLGHGIGVEIHEQPNLKPKSIDKIKKSMCFTIEPGIYFNKIGIRIEDDVLITNKVEILTKTKKELIIIK